MPTPPVNVKTWQHQVNNMFFDLGTAVADFKRLLRGLKNLLLGFGTFPWTVQYSCNSAVAGAAGDGVDRWAADSDIVWTSAAAAHSWIVLQQSGVQTGFQVCIECKETGFTTIETGLVVVTSIAGFTGGTTTARPTATDEVVLTDGTVANGDWNGVGSGSGARAAFTSVLHALQSTDGAGTRIGISFNNFVTGFWLFDQPLAPIAGWTNPYVATARGQGGGSDSCTPTNYCKFSTTPFKTNINGVVAPVVLTVEGANAGGVASFPYGLPDMFRAPNEITGEWHLCPVGVASQTAGARGRFSRVFDFWFTSMTNDTGNSYPEDDSRTWMVFGNVLQPWNGVIPRFG